MIKVGITGADTPLGGELIRLLIHHPEVELKSLYAPSSKGISVSDFHRGLEGDTRLKFSESLNFSELDVLFIIDNSIIRDFSNELPEDLKVIRFSKSSELKATSPFNAIEYVPGLSEMFRKPLVRGAKAAEILISPVSILLIALYPLAMHLLLNDSLKVKISLPSVLEGRFSPEEIAAETEKYLKSVQLSFNRLEKIETSGSKALRGMEIEIEFPCSVSEQEIEKIFDSVYDDHNFSFVVSHKPELTEVAGTQKCLLYLSKPTPELLRINAVADGILRGGAGDAVHVMNLLFGLFEKTGLSLQASLAFINPE